MESLPTLDEMVTEAKRAFRDRFGVTESVVASCAPGRVNIIGEHVDYNGGFVLPMAMPMWTVVVGVVSRTGDSKCRVHTNLANIECPDFDFDLPSNDSSTPLAPFKDPKLLWANYILGTVTEFFKIHPSPWSGFDCCIVSSVPLGAGLSSSASLEAAVFTFLENLHKVETDQVEKALACQRAEHTFANVPCGIMDQFASILCQENKLLYLDCESQKFNHLSFDFPDHAFLVINSQVKHQLADGAYRKRRAMCEKVASVLGVATLRLADLRMLEENSDKFDEEHIHKAMHVIKEIDRTRQVFAVLSSGDQSQQSLIAIGQFMNQSHESLKTLYDVSCVEIDTLVECAVNQPGVLGARITGGGFGGCCVVLLEKSVVPAVVESLERMYKEKFGKVPIFYMATPQKGAAHCVT